VLYRHAIATHPAGHAQALEYTAWGRPRADRARRAPAVRLAMGLARAAEAVPLDYALEALALGGTDDVDQLPNLENGDVEPLANFELARIADAPLTEVAQHRCPRLRK